jgi:DNA-binding MarR family transcriptional regulator
MGTPRVSRESAVFMSRFCASANLRRTARVVTRHYDRALRAAGVTATQLPLLAAINAGVTTSISSLAEELDLERSTISRELDGLKRLGLIDTATGTEDKRATKLMLTPRGHKTLSAAFEAWQRAHEAITSEYGGDEFESLLTQTRKLGQTVKGLPRK